MVVEIQERVVLSARPVTVRVETDDQHLLSRVGVRVGAEGGHTTSSQVLLNNVNQRQPTGQIQCACLLGLRH